MFGTNPIRKKVVGSGSELEVQSIFSTIQGEGPFAGRPAIFLRLAGCNLRCFFCDTDFESKRRIMYVEDIIRQISRLAHEDPKQRFTSLVVITGGEPMRQNILGLCTLLVSKGYVVQIETAGTVWPEGLEDLAESGSLHFVCSPKTGHVVNEVALSCSNWKYLIKEGEGEISDLDGLPMMSTQVKGMPLKLYRPERPTDTVWLQPCEEYRTGYQAFNKPLLCSDGDTIEHSEGVVKLFNANGELKDQATTSSVRDEEKTRRNIELAVRLAMKYNYRISLQIHKLLNLP